MKYAYLLMAASIGLLVGCSQVEQDLPDVNSISESDLVEKVIFEVLPVKDGDDPETKASAVPNGGSVGFVWEATDTVGIYPGRGSQVYFNIEDGVGSNSVSFTGGDWALKQNATYTSYYPFVGDIYLKRDKIPVSFAGQKQVGTTSPFIGARYYLATGASTSENGVLRFSYSTLNTIINVNATLPAGTYTKASLTIEEPLFVEEGTYSLDDHVIVGTKFTSTLEIELENVVLTEEATIPIYIMSAPVDLKGKKVTVRITTADGSSYKCIKTPTKEYMAGTRYGLTCDEMERDGQPVPEAIDLGLSVKWAAFNLGATTPEEYGDYYAWGEVTPKERYYWDTYKWCDGTDNSLTKYNSENDYGIVDNNNVLDLEDDAAHYALRGDWRMPSTKEWEELINPNNCVWIWTTQNDVNGYLVTSKRTDNSIFLPVAGYKSYDQYNPCNSSFTYYWLNELIDPNDSKWNNTNYYRYSDKASTGNFRQGEVDSYFQMRYSGLPIRPILEADESILTCEDHLDLWVGFTRPLNVTVHKSLGEGLSYFSKDESIVTIDNNGTVQAVGVGTATVRVSTVDGTNSAYCSVTVYPAPEIIDLGLTVKWASFNIGATTPDDRGFLLAWGETHPKRTYSWATYKWCNGSEITLTKYNTKSEKGTVDNRVILDDNDDVARLWSNGQWRMPTKAEVDELYRNCEKNSTGGSATFTSKVNGNSIYFPDAGNGYAIWTSELGDGVTIDYPEFATVLAGGGWQSYRRFVGITVRAVLVEN